MSLMQFLTQIEDPQVDCGARQKRPETQDTVESPILEMESYLLPKARNIVSAGGETQPSPIEGQQVTVAVATGPPLGMMTQCLQ